MSRSKMFDGKVATPAGAPDADATPEAPSPRTTIVGGRPPEDGAHLPPVPTGIQQLLRLASVDAAFCKELIARRDAMADVAGVELTASEALVLRAAPALQLEQMVGSMPPPAPDRRTFLRQTASTAVMLLGGAALAATTGCKRPENREMQNAGGAAPDEPPPRNNRREMETEGGAAPDEPDAAVQRPDRVQPPTAIAPDEPPLKRPPHTELPTAGGAAPDVPTPPRLNRREMETDGGANPNRPPPRADVREMLTTGGAAPDKPPERPKRPSPTRGIRPRRPDAGAKKPRGR